MKKRAEVIRPNSFAVGNTRFHVEMSVVFLVDVFPFFETSESGGK